MSVSFPSSEVTDSLYFDFRDLKSKQKMKKKDVKMQDTKMLIAKIKKKKDHTLLDVKKNFESLIIFTFWYRDELSM